MTRGGVLHMMQSANAFMTPDGSMSHQAVIVCNAATGVRNGDALVCPETWLAPLKFKDGARHAAYDIGTGSGTERWRGDVTFFYFDRDTGRLKVDAEHNFFADASALPGMVVRIREASSRQVKQIDYDVHSEWRLQHCGSPNGSWRNLCQ